MHRTRRVNERSGAADGVPFAPSPKRRESGPMTGWRDEIVGALVAGATHLTVVADPDELLLEERLLQRISERGFHLITFDDPVAFRFESETRLRSMQDQGEDVPQRILIRASGPNPDALPHDILARGHRLSLGLDQLFPKLSYPVVASLDRSGLDDLFAAQRLHPPAGRLGDRETRAYVLRHVFGVAPETIAREEHLLRFLLRRHYRRLPIPKAFDHDVLRFLGKIPAFREWPLARIVPDRRAFFAFLQERWPAFLDRITADAVVREDAPPARYEIRISGAVDIDFDHEDVRVYVDNLFCEGVLQPVPHAKAKRLGGSWATVGVATDPATDRARRMMRLLKSLQENVPGEAAGHRDWLDFALRWATLAVLDDDLAGTGADPGTTSRLDALRDRIDESFAAWLAARYATLHNLPPLPPVMLHHVPRVLARHMAGGRDRKVAVVLADGLALDQWMVLRDSLASQRPKLRFRESAVFAWIPTLTSVSRQACFAGRPPLHFSSAIARTDGEPAAWQRFWVDEGLVPSAAPYEKNLRNRDDLGRAAAVASGSEVRAVALVVDVVDRIMHGMVLGSSGMRSQVGHWADGGMLAELLDILLDCGFSVFLTSDHGNIETRGCGRPADGALVETYGKRVRIYDDPVLRDRVLEEHPGAVAWPPVGLPERYHPLIAPGRSSFVREGERPVAHGGATLEEVVVPLVEIEAP